MRQVTDVLSFQTRGRGLLEVTDQVKAWTSKQGMREGLPTLFCRHLGLASHPGERRQRGSLGFEAFFEAIAPEDPTRYAHDDEGPDDMPAHIRAALTQVHLNIPVVKNAPALGTWQGVYLFEHRREPHRREIAVHPHGE